MLQASDYNYDYFDGSHPAGLGGYRRIQQSTNGAPLDPWDHFAERHYSFYLKHMHDLQAGKVLSLGCAKGFDVEDLRKLGIDAWGLDISEYAVGESPVSDYLQVGDATLWDGYFQGVDTIFGFGILECLNDEQLGDLASSLSQVAKSIFSVFPTNNLSQEKIDSFSQFYNLKSISEWESLFSSSVLYFSNENNWSNPFAD